jgi:hypothetical protein
LDEGVSSNGRGLAARNEADNTDLAAIKSEIKSIIETLGGGV